MKTVGYLLITAGFLGGALAAVVDIHEIRWPWFAAAAMFGAAGVVLVRVATRRHHTSEGKLAFNMEAVRASLERIAAHIADLDGRKAEIGPYDMRSWIDRLFPDDIAQFVDARHSISHMYGLQAYADVMSPFAAGERYLNRVWSASADGYIDEVNEYLGRAREQFADSLTVLRKLKEPPS